jgi:hypothetical protein
MSGTWHSGCLLYCSRAGEVVQIRINLRPDGLLWRIGVIEIRSPEQYESILLDHLPPATYDDAMELAKRHALQLIGVPAVEDVKWDIHPKRCDPP